MKKELQSALDEKKTVGVVIGRFQVHRLHKGHVHLIDTVQKENDILCVLLGSSGANLTKRNPLTFSHRKGMLLERYKKAQIFEIIDSPTWSDDLDRLLSSLFKNRHVKLYGSRDSFAKEYFGKYEVVTIEEKYHISGTEVRSKKSAPKDRESFRMGLIEGQNIRYPISYQTVDIALINERKREIILGRKSHNASWCLPGGFVDPSDESLEEAALRELREEITGIVLKKELTYIGSSRVRDHRYRNEEDKIMTSLFMTCYKSGTPVAGDDLEEVAWFSFEEAKKVITVEHMPLLIKIIKYLK